MFNVNASLGTTTEVQSQVQLPITLLAAGRRSENVCQQIGPIGVIDAHLIGKYSLAS